MEYLEAIAIKRLRPDSLPTHLAHLPDEADRVIKLRAAMCGSNNAPDSLALPILSQQQISRVNAVLLHNLALAMGLLQPWGGPRKQEFQPKGAGEVVLPLEAGPSARAAKPGPNATPTDRFQ